MSTHQPTAPCATVHVWPHRHPAAGQQATKAAEAAATANVISMQERAALARAVTEAQRQIQARRRERTRAVVLFVCGVVAGCAGAAVLVIDLMRHAPH